MQTRLHSLQVSTLRQALCGLPVLTVDLNKPAARSRTATHQEHTKRRGPRPATRQGLGHRPGVRGGRPHLCLHDLDTSPGRRPGLSEE